MTMTQIFALMTYIMMGVQVVLQYFDTQAVQCTSWVRTEGMRWWKKGYSKLQGWVVNASKAHFFILHKMK